MGGPYGHGEQPAEWDEGMEMADDDELEEPEGLLVVRNLPRRTTHQKLRTLFEQHGEVVDVHIPRNKVLKCNREFAFVKMAKISDAEMAQRELNHTTHMKQEIQVVLGHERRSPQPTPLLGAMAMPGTMDTGLPGGIDTMQFGTISALGMYDPRAGGSRLSPLSLPPRILSGGPSPTQGDGLPGIAGGAAQTHETGLTPRGLTPGELDTIDEGIAGQEGTMQLRNKFSGAMAKIHALSASRKGPVQSTKFKYMDEASIWMMRGTALGAACCSVYRAAMMHFVLSWAAMMHVLTCGARGRCTQPWLICDAELVGRS